MAKPELYFCTDIETDGPCPGLNSMLSLATAVYSPEKELLDTFSVNLETLPEASPNPVTTAWWKNWPEAWAECRKDLQKPEEALPKYVAWINSFDCKPVFVAYPAGFDFTFVYYYMHRFAGGSPFKCVSICIRTYAMAVLKREFQETTRETMPKSWFDPDLPHTHIALDDALEQGALFCNILKANYSSEGSDSS
jgi:hypothetical protein